MRTPPNLLRNLCFTLVLFASLSLCALALNPHDQPSLRDLRRVRREITEALQPSIAVAGKDKTVVSAGILQEEVTEYARAGAGTADTQQDPPPGADDSFVAEHDSADFIAADVGQETGTVQDPTTFVGTAEIEPGTTPPETTATIE